MWDKSVEEYKKMMENSMTYEDFLKNYEKKNMKMEKVNKININKENYKKMIEKNKNRSYEEFLKYVEEKKMKEKEERNKDMKLEDFLKIKKEIDNKEFDKKDDTDNEIIKLRSIVCTDKENIDKLNEIVKKYDYSFAFNKVFSCLIYGQVYNYCKIVETCNVGDDILFYINVDTSNSNIYTQITVSLKDFMTKNFKTNWIPIDIIKKVLNSYYNFKSEKIEKKENNCNCNKNDCNCKAEKNNKNTSNCNSNKKIKIKKKSEKNKSDLNSDFIFIYIDDSIDLSKKPDYRKFKKHTENSKNIKFRKSIEENLDISSKIRRLVRYMPNSKSLMYFDQATENLRKYKIIFKDPAIEKEVIEKLVEGNLPIPFKNEFNLYRIDIEKGEIEFVNHNCDNGLSMHITFETNDIKDIIVKEIS